MYFQNNEDMRRNALKTLIAPYALCLEHAREFNRALNILKSDNSVLFDSASAMKSIDANIKRGRNAMSKSIVERNTVHRGMFRTGMGWVDFVYGDMKKGIEHIFLSRSKYNQMSDDEIIKLLVIDVVDCIAKGENLGDQDVRTNGKINQKIRLGNVTVQLTKEKGGNTWIVTAFDRPKGASGKGDGKLTPTEHQSYAERIDAVASVVVSDADNSVRYRFDATQVTLKEAGLGADDAVNLLLCDDDVNTFDAVQSERDKVSPQN